MNFDIMHKLLNKRLKSKELSNKVAYYMCTASLNHSAD